MASPACRYWANLAVEDLNVAGCQLQLERIMANITQSQLLSSAELNALQAAVFTPVGHVT